jgi:hypothetical protein
MKPEPRTDTDPTLLNSDIDIFEKIKGVHGSKV